MKRTAAQGASGTDAGSGSQGKLSEDMVTLSKQN
jgi:hypothetical protein